MLLKWSEVKVTQSFLTLCNPRDCSQAGSSVHGILQARILEWVVVPFSRESSQARIEPRSPALQADSLPSEPPGKLKVYESGSDSTQLCLTLDDPMDYTPWNSPGQNSGVGSLSLLQGVFPTQGSNPGLPHRRRILYQLSHKGSPVDYYSALKRNEVLTLVTVWRYLENTTLSE